MNSRSPWPTAWISFWTIHRKEHQNWWTALLETQGAVRRTQREHLLYPEKREGTFGGHRQSRQLGEVDRAKTYFTEIKPIMAHNPQACRRLRLSCPTICGIAEVKEMLFIC